MSTYFDIEILQWFSDPEIVKLEKWRQHRAMTFGLATTYGPTGEVIDDEEQQGFVTWYQKDIEHLYYYLENNGGPIVTWNGDEFDIPYLITHAVVAGATKDPWGNLPPSLDLMALIRRESKRIDGKERWYKLDVIAQANLGRGKIGHGDEAAEWLRSGDPALNQKAAEYCQDDVLLVKQLHEILLAGDSLICPARPERREYRELHVFLPAQDGGIEREE